MNYSQKNQTKSFFETEAKNWSIKSNFKNKVLNPLCFGTLTNGHPRHPNPRPINDYPIDTQLISYRQN